MGKMDFGLIGLGVMGENLARNIGSKGFSLSVYARGRTSVENFVSNFGKDFELFGALSLEDFVDSLAKPRKIMLMIKAGDPVDSVIGQLLPLLDEGDLIIDGGNSYYEDTNRRLELCEGSGILYIGTGVSGGEEGALNGPSIMPGGSVRAWPLVKEIFQAISAKADDGLPCCEWMGPGGAGHYVKMIHNGIEYGDMQLIAEAYQIMKDYLGMEAGEIGQVFDRWNKGKLESYLIEITAEILAYKDEDGGPLVDKILDVAGQKGTGKWTSIGALDQGIPLTLISEAVFARFLSSLKDERLEASRKLLGDNKTFKGTDEEKSAFIDTLEEALYASKIISYAQGFATMMAASNNYGWDLDYGNIAMIWRGGCIIRSVFLTDVKEAFHQDKSLKNLMMAPFFTKALGDAQGAWRQLVAQAVLSGVSIPAISSALAYYDGYRSETLSANLLQAQRDYFGAHTYERTDGKRGDFHHTNWTGKGGTTASTVYSG